MPKTPQETHFLREKWGHLRWLSSKLLSDTFGDKQKVEQKIDNHLIISWGEPNADIKKVENVVDQVPSVDVKAIPRASTSDTQTAESGDKT